MKQSVAFIYLLMLLTGCVPADHSLERVLPSPGSNMSLYFNLNNGDPYYLVYHEDDIVIDWSQMGFSLNNKMSRENFSICNTNTDSIPDNDTEILSAVFGEAIFNKMEICLNNGFYPGLHMMLQFRIYNSGIAFRYVLNQKEMVFKNFSDETEFELRTDHLKWDYHRDTLFREINSMQPGDSLLLPAMFRSNTGKTVHVLSMGLQKVNGSNFLVPYDLSKGEFRFRDSFHGNNDNTSGIITPWRIIVIKSNDG